MVYLSTRIFLFFHLPSIDSENNIDDNHFMIPSHDVFLQHRWQQIKGDVTYYTTVISTQYDEPARFYHNKNHLVDLFTKLDTLTMDADVALQQLMKQNKKVLTYAVFFHDIVYNPKKTDNEEKSVHQWQSYALSLSLKREMIKQVSELIQATKNHTEPTSNPLTALFLDLDLSILGSHPEAFAAYDAAIAQEYNYLDPVVYRQKRKTFLQSIGNPYHTVYFKTHFGKQTNENRAFYLAHH